MKKKVSESKDKIAADDKLALELDEEIRQMLLKTPNLPDPSLPIGTDDSFNKAVKYWGTPRDFKAEGFEPKSHWDLGLADGDFDFERGVKVAGPRFTFYKGLFARLERSCAAFMLDYHTSHGYTEILPPYMVNTETMTGTGQLPKFKDQAYHVDNQTEGDFGLFLLQRFLLQIIIVAKSLMKNFLLDSALILHVLELKPVQQDVILVVSFVSINSKRLNLSHLQSLRIHSMNLSI